MKIIFSICMSLLAMQGVTQGPVKKTTNGSKVIIKQTPVVTSQTGKTTSKLTTKPSSGYRLNSNVLNMMAGYTTHTQNINGKTIRSKMIPVNGGLQPVSITRAKQV